jgi:hypothetical protein
MDAASLWTPGALLGVHVSGRSRSAGLVVRLPGASMSSRRRCPGVFPERRGIVTCTRMLMPSSVRVMPLSGRREKAKAWGWAFSPTRCPLLNPGSAPTGLPGEVSSQGHQLTVDLAGLGAPGAVERPPHDSGLRGKPVRPGSDGARHGATSGVAARTSRSGHATPRQPDRTVASHRRAPGAVTA